MNKKIALLFTVSLISGCSNHYLDEYKELCKTENSIKPVENQKSPLPDKIIIKLSSDYQRIISENLLMHVNSHNIPLLVHLNEITIPIDQAVERRYRMHEGVYLPDDTKYLKIERKKTEACLNKDIMKGFDEDYHNKNKCFELIPLKEPDTNNVLLYEVKSNNPENYPRYDQENLYLNEVLLQTKSIYTKQSPHYYKPIGGYNITCKDFK